MNLRKYEREQKKADLGGQENFEQNFARAKAD